MDSNKEEALHALCLAEKRFEVEDFKGAMKLALKAQKLFPSLQNLVQTIATYEVHLLATTKKLTSGETNWHSVLHVNPSADYDTIKKQFKKMCLLTRPDKNRHSSAADGAFKLVMKAWSILSSGSFSTSNPKPKKKPKEPKSQDWDYLYAKIRCDRCGLLHQWDFRRLSKHCDKSLYYYCKDCSEWCVIKNRAARVEILLTCDGCHYKLKWGCYRPFGYDCSSCGSNYVAVVDPDWIPKCQQTGPESSFRPETMSCPYCGAWTAVEVGYGGAQCFVDCKTCGLCSIIELNM